MKSMKIKNDADDKETLTQLSYEITGFAIKVHKSIRPGLLESVYENCLKYELESNGYQVRQQVIVPIRYNEVLLNTELKLDLLVNNCVAVELKAIEHILPVHHAQLLAYMKLLKMPHGLLINFFTDNIAKTMRPLVNESFKILPDE